MRGLSLSPGLGLALALLVLGSSCPALSTAGQAGQGDLFAISGYYRHFPHSPAGKGVRLRYEADFGPLVSLFEFIGEARGAMRGASLGWALYYDLNPHLFICGGASLGLGAGLFPRARSYIELDLKAPYYPALVLAAGLGRNEYEQGADVQADAGLTLYGPAFTAYYRWFGFWREAGRPSASQQIFQLALRPRERAELVLTLLLEGPRAAEEAVQVLTISYEFWPMLERGWKVALELGRRGAERERLGLEVGRLLALP